MYELLIYLLGASLAFFIEWYRTRRLGWHKEDIKTALWVSLWSWAGVIIGLVFALDEMEY